MRRIGTPFDARLHVRPRLTSRAGGMKKIQSQEVNGKRAGRRAGSGRRTWRSVSIVNMADPLAMTIAANVAAKIAETLTGQAQQAVATIVRKIRQKLRSRPAEAGEVATLDAAITTSDAPAAEALAEVLERLFAADPRFREEIRRLWDSAGVADSLTNVFSGKADKVIMMRDVNGDLTIN